MVKYRVCELEMGYFQMSDKSIKAENILKGDYMTDDEVEVLVTESEEEAMEQLKGMSCSAYLTEGTWGYLVHPEIAYVEKEIFDDDGDLVSAEVVAYAEWTADEYHFSR